MGKYRKLYETILSGRSDASIGFEDLRSLLLHLGFEERIRGSHHLFVKEGVVRLLNLQRAGAQAKRYQVKQVREALVESGLEATE